VALERGPLILVRITEELFEWKSSGFGSRKARLTAVGIPLRSPRDILYPQKLALTSPTCGASSVGIVRLRTKVTELVSNCAVEQLVNCKLAGGTHVLFEKTRCCGKPVTNRESYGAAQLVVVQGQRVISPRYL
jgi:hypothetical protein